MGSFTGSVLRNALVATNQDGEGDHLTVSSRSTFTLGVVMRARDGREQDERAVSRTMWAAPALTTRKTRRPVSGREEAYAVVRDGLANDWTGGFHRAVILGRESWASQRTEPSTKLSSRAAKLASESFRIPAGSVKHR